MIEQDEKLAFSEDTGPRLDEGGKETTNSEDGKRMDGGRHL